MIRRRLPKTRENFSFDSFLDVVANVVGIIIRLILVVGWGSVLHLARQISVLAEAEPNLPALEAKETDEPVYHVMQAEHRQLKQLEADCCSNFASCSTSVTYARKWSLEKDACFGG